MYSAVLFGFMTGLAGGLIYFLYAVVFRFGAFIVTVDTDNVAYTSYKDFIM